MRGSLLILMIPLAACSSDGGDPIGRSGNSDAIAVQPLVSLEDGCDAPPPATWEIDGTMHTVVMSPEPVAVTITSAPAKVCPGGSTTFTAIFENEGEVPLVMSSPKLILSGGAQKWILATMDEVRVAAGEIITVSADATVPLVAPGKYEVFVYGFGPGGVVEIAEPLATD